MTERRLLCLIIESEKHSCNNEIDAQKRPSARVVTLESSCNI